MSDPSRPDADPDAAPIERGIHNPQIVDLIERDDSTNAVVLVALQRTPWLAGAAGAQQMQDKLNAYFAYALEGHLKREYPGYEDRVVRIAVEWTDPPPDPVRETFAEAEEIARRHRLEFVDRRIASPESRRAPWEQD